MPIGVFLVAMTAISASALDRELSGFVGTDVRVFPERPAFEEQVDRRVQPSLVLQPELRLEWNGWRDRLTIVPFVRLEYDDPARRHADLRELHWMHAEDDWDLTVGIAKVYWGVAESRHLVDVVNQVDTAEDLDEEDRLGQPMIRLTLLRDWGTTTLFAMAPFRERTFPSTRGRLSGGLPVKADRARYDTSLGRWHPDLAVRWAHVLGDFDVGLAYLWATSREPRLALETSANRPPFLRPRYDRMHQVSLDVQATLESWLWKLETIVRHAREDTFSAAVGGVEYTFFGVGGTDYDLGVLAEYLWDDRDERRAPPTPFEDDFFGGARLTLNDVQSTSFLAGAIVDRDTQATFGTVEASRRVGERWTVELAARLLANTSDDPLLSAVRRDSYLELRLARYF